MKELNELVELASKADGEVTWALLPFDLTKDGWCPEVVNYIAAMSPHAIKGIAEALLSLEQRAEAAESERDEAVMLRLEVSGSLSSATIRYEKAEAKLADLEKQEPVGYTYSRGINCEIVAADLNDDCPCGADLFTRPAPAIDLNAVRADAIESVVDALTSSGALTVGDSIVEVVKLAERIRAGNAGKDGV